MWYSNTTRLDQKIRSLRSSRNSAYSRRHSARSVDELILSTPDYVFLQFLESFMDLVKEIQRLKDIEAVRSLITKYAQAADAYSAPDLMRPLFAQSAVWKCESLAAHFEGREAVTKGLAKTREAEVFWTMHFNISPLIEISDAGTSGKVFWYLWELARTSLGGRSERENTWIAGWYQADIVVENGVWCFSRVELTLRLVTPAAGLPWPVDQQ
jgi:hypothetical protein